MNKKIVYIIFCVSTLLPAVNLYSALVVSKSDGALSASKKTKFDEYLKEKRLETHESYIKRLQALATILGVRSRFASMLMYSDKIEATTKGAQKALQFGIMTLEFNSLTIAKLLADKYKDLSEVLDELLTHLRVIKSATFSIDTQNNAKKEVLFLNERYQKILSILNKENRKEENGSGQDLPATLII